MVFDPVWAEDPTASVEVPSNAEIRLGFECGAAKPGVFNWLFQQLQSAINALDVSGLVANTRNINTTEGVQGGGNLTADRTLRLDINGLEQETSIAPGDLVAIYDVSSGLHRKMVRSDFVAGLGGVGFITGGANIGTGTGEVFASLNGTIMEFRKLLNAGGLSIVAATDDVAISLSPMAAELTVE